MRLPGWRKPAPVCVASRRSRPVSSATRWLGACPNVAYPSRSLVGRAVAEGLTWDPHLIGSVERLPASALVREVGSDRGAF